MVAARFGDATIFHHVDNVSMHRRSKPMGDDDRGAANCQLAKPQQPVSLGPGIQSTGRLIQDYYWSLAQECSGQRNPLPFAHTQVSAAREPFAKDAGITFREASNN